MTYFGVLLSSMGVPLLALASISALDLRRCQALRPPFRSWSPWLALLGLVLLALVYTTPWDNYLVANRIWWYAPDRVTGVTLGWVPIEEYTFFVVQTLVVGLWLLLWMRRMPVPAVLSPLWKSVRWVSAVVGSLLWGTWLAVLLSRWPRGLYMALILVWALPPIVAQLAFGADILWRYRRLVLVGLLPAFLYLCLVDAVAIGSSVWTINPNNVLGVYLGGVLPLEEAVFFLVTSMLVVSGMVLVLAQESHVRAGLSPKAEAT